MKNYIIVLMIILAITTIGFSKTSIGVFGAMEMPNSSPIWVGTTLRSVGGGLIGFEVAAMIEKNALFAGDFTSFQVMPTLYLCIPMGSSFTVYAGAAPVIYILGTSINVKQDAFYVRGGAQFSAGAFELFVSASELFFVQGFTPSKKFGIEGGVALSF